MVMEVPPVNEELEILQTMSDVELRRAYQYMSERCLLIQLVIDQRDAVRDVRETRKVKLVVMPERMH